MLSGAATRSPTRLGSPDVRALSQAPALAAAQAPATRPPSHEPTDDLRNVLARSVAQRAKSAHPILQRWAFLGEESWYLPASGWQQKFVYTGTEEEWSSTLDNIDDYEEYVENIQGFLEACNRPGIVYQKAAPSGIPPHTQYYNDIYRRPVPSERVDFMRALFGKGEELDLWHGGALEGGPWVRDADKQLAQFIRESQGYYLAALAAEGDVVDTEMIGFVAAQGGPKATTAMIVNAGATAFKGIDLWAAAAAAGSNQGKKKAAMIVRNAAITIRGALQAHKARVEFEQAIVSGVFDKVWGAIPGGGLLLDLGKDLLKPKLAEGLTNASKVAWSSGAPDKQGKAIYTAFQKAAYLVPADLLSAEDSLHLANTFASEWHGE